MSALQPKRMNFAARAEEKKAEKKRVKPAVLLIIAAVVLVALAEGVMLGRIWLRIRPQLSELLLQMAAPELQEKYDEARSLQEELAGVETVATGFADAFAAADAYPDMDGDLFAMARDLTGGNVHITGWEYTGVSGEFVLYCQAEDALEASDYAARLREAELFQRVAYYGYDSDEETTALSTDAPSGAESAAGAYSFAVICTMEGGSAE